MGVVNCMKLYDFVETSPGAFQLFQSSVLLCTFHRGNIREVLESVGRTSNWIGSMIRLFHLAFPAPIIPRISDKSDYIRELGVSGMIDHFKGMGFRVEKRLKVSDIELIKHYEDQGYCFEGLLGDCYYSTLQNALVEKRCVL